MKKRIRTKPRAKAKLQPELPRSTDTDASISKTQHATVASQKFRFWLAVVVFTCWLGFLSYLAFLSLKGAP